MRANMKIRIALLTNSDENHRLEFHDLPINLTNGKPSVINSKTNLYRISHGIDHIDRIRFMVGFLDDNRQPNLVDGDPHIGDRSLQHRCQALLGLVGFLPQENMMPGHPVNVIL